MQSNDQTTVQFKLPDGTETPKIPLKDFENLTEKILDNEVRRARAEKPLDNSGGLSGERLRSFIQRIERLEEDKAAIGEDLKEIFAECKGVGFDTKIIRQIVRMRKIEIEKRRENEELLSLYCAAIGME